MYDHAETVTTTRIISLRDFCLDKGLSYNTVISRIWRASPANPDGSFVKLTPDHPALSHAPFVNGNPQVTGRRDMQENVAPAPMAPLTSAAGIAPLETEHEVGARA